MKIKYAWISLLIILVCGVPQGNAYDNQDASFYLLRLINEARREPLKVLSEYGFDIQDARIALGDRAWILELEGGLPPLAWNEKLYSAAMGHNRDMIEKFYYDFNSKDPFMRVIDRVRQAGYEADFVDESLGIIAFDSFINPMESAFLIFKSILRDEMNPDSGLPKNIFNPDFIETGIALTATTFNIGNDQPINVYLLVADFARPLNLRSYIVGNVYYESDRWTPSVVADDIDIFVKVYSLGIDLKLDISPLGTFQIPAFPVFYFLEARNKDGHVLVRKNVFGYNINQLINIEIQ